jgi:hypothetical protein
MRAVTGARRFRGAAHGGIYFRVSAIGSNVTGYRRFERC